MAPRVRFGLTVTRSDLNLPAPALEASEADAGRVMPYSDYIEGKYAEPERAGSRMEMNLQSQ